MVNQAPDRFYVNLAGPDEEKVKTLLHQATNLWNCLVTHIGDTVLDIARSDGDQKEIETAIHDIVMMAYQFLIHGQDIGVRFAVADIWKHRIRHIKKLPHDIKINRVCDLIQAYHHVHKKHRDRVEYPYVPKVKIKGSTETVRFSSKSWDIQNDRVKLDLHSEVLTFRVPGIDQIKHKPSSLTLTKKRPSRSKSIQPVEGVTRSKYFVSLSAV